MNFPRFVAEKQRFAAADGRMWQEKVFLAASKAEAGNVN
jgi:hypothetical protein